MHRLTSKLNMRLTALLCAFLLCAVMVAPIVAAAPLAEGEMEGLSWSLNNGTLAISGKGAIPDYTEQNPAPWHEHRDSILRLELDKNITAVGDMAFYECTALVTANLPESVKTVGYAAFAGCESMITITMPGVTELGDYAFSRCFSLARVTLPDTLTVVGGYAFYRCDSLIYMCVPETVTTIGSSAFAYCAALLWVDIRSPLTVLPEWCFYGCENLQMVIVPATLTGAGDSAFTRCDALSTVCHGGDDAARQAFSEAIAESLPGFTVSQVGSVTDVPPAVSGKDVVADGDTAQEITTEVTQEGETILEVEQVVTYPAKDGVAKGDPQSFDSTVHATIGTQQGFDDVSDSLREQLNQKTTFESEYGEQKPVRADIVLQTDLPLTNTFLESLAGRDVIATITSPNGSRFTINGRDIAGYSYDKEYTLEYTLTPCDKLSEKEKNIVGTATCYWLDFQSAFKFPVTVELLADPYAVHQSATLYEKNPSGLQKLQVSMVDTRGFVSFRLVTINTTTRYLLAMNVAGTQSNEIIVPEENEDVVDFAPLSDRYTITDVRGFLGLTMQEFTNLVLTVVGIFVGVVVLIGAFIVIRSKRKAKIAAIRAEVMGNETPRSDTESIEER